LTGSGLSRRPPAGGGLSRWQNGKRRVAKRLWSRLSGTAGIGLVDGVLWRRSLLRDKRKVQRAWFTTRSDARRARTPGRHFAGGGPGQVAVWRFAHYP